MPARWHTPSIFGTGPRIPLDRERRARFRALLHLNRRPGRLTIGAAQLGRVLVDMLGADGRLDPSHATLAIRAGLALSTVKTALEQLKALGFVSWVRRLVRGPETAWRAEQTSNAYVLCLPLPCEADFRPAVRKKVNLLIVGKLAAAQLALFPASARDLLAERRRAMQARWLDKAAGGTVEAV